MRTITCPIKNGKKCISTKNINAKDDQDKITLFRETNTQKLAYEIQLLERGADINIEVEDGGSRLTPFARAMLLEKLDTAESLLKQGGIHKIMMVKHLLQ